MQYQARRVRNSARFPGAIFDTASFPIAVEMKDLYQSCLDAVLQDDDMKFHVVMRPMEPGTHYIVAAGENEEFEHGADLIDGKPVGEHDCVVVLCRRFLTEEKSHTEMMKIVITDVCDYINDNYSMVEPASGAVGSILSWVAATHTLSSLVGLKDADLIGSMVEEFKKVSATSFGGGNVVRIGTANQNSNAHSEIMDRLCERIEETNGCHLSLPVKMMDIVDSGRSILSQVLDERGL
jgi:hypothetical protein